MENRTLDYYMKDSVSSQDPLTNIKKDLKDIFYLIKDEMESLKDKNASEIDFSMHYDKIKNALASFFVLDLSREDNLKIRNSIEFKYAILSLSLHIAKNKIARSFWNVFYDELSIDSTYYQKLQPNLLETLNLIGIIPEKKGNRNLLVGTIRMKVESDINFLTDSTEMFIRYYKEFNGKPFHENEFKSFLKNQELYTKYKDKDKDEQIFIIFQKLFKITDYVIENAINYLDDEQALKSLIINDLKINPDFVRKRISTIVKSVFNRTTPRRFLKVLQEHRGSDVILPNSVKIKAGNLLDKKLKYGEYHIGDVSYQLVPDIRLNLETIVNWDYEKLGSFNNKFRYYKKTEPFHTTIGEIKEFEYNNNKFFLWFGSVPIGQKYDIDNFTEIQEGFFWRPNLHLKWPREDDAKIILEIGKLNCHFKNLANKKLIISSKRENGVEIENIQVKLDSNGSFFYRDMEFSPEGIHGKIHLEAKLNGKIVKEITFNLDHSMLFSSNTREHIKSNFDSNSVKRQFGENKYYLFSIDDLDNIISSDEVEIIPNGNFGDYFIYEIKWNSSKNFYLKTSLHEWKFERKAYLECWFENNEKLFSSISDIKLNIHTNFDSLDLGEDFSIRILNNDYETIGESFEMDKNQISQNFTVNGEDICKYALNHDLNLGEYILELDFNGHIRKLKFYIVPEVQVDWPILLKENEKTLIPVRTLNKKPALFDIKSNQTVNKLKIPLEGNAIIYSKDMKNLPKVKFIKPSISVNFIIKNEFSSFSTFNKKFLKKEFFSDDRMSIFGYRIYRLENGNYIETSQLNYYDIPNSLLFVFTKPGAKVDIEYNGRKILSKIANNDGICIFEKLRLLKFHIHSYSNDKSYSKSVFSVKSYGISKNLQVNWYPQIYCVNNPKFGEKSLKANVVYNGPLDSEIQLKLLDNRNKIVDIKNMKCHNVKVSEEVEFLIDQFDQRKYYIMSYIFNGVWIPSKYLKLYNESKNKIIIKLNKQEYKTSINNFFDKIQDLIQIVLSENNFYKFYIPGFYLQKEFVKLISIYDPEVKVLVPNEKYLDSLKPINEITGYKNSVKIIKYDEYSLNRELDTFNINELCKKGLGISNSILASEISKYLPKKETVVVFDSPELHENIKNKIFNSPDRTIIFIERG